MRRGEGDYEIKKDPFLPSLRPPGDHHKTLEAVISDRPALKAPNLSAHIIGLETYNVGRDDYADIFI